MFSYYTLPRFRLHLRTLNVKKFSPILKYQWDNYITVLANQKKVLVRVLKAKLTDMAHSFCGTLIDITNFTMQRKYF